MIELFTGLPGEGKTLLAVTLLAKLMKEWDTEKGAADRREVWQYGIKGLTLPHKTIEVWPEGGKRGDPVPRDVRGRPTCNLLMDWSDIPDGALVLIDEAQYVFPVRGPSGKVPTHVTFLNTHRHAGLDIWLITQHPKLIDNATRRLISKHIHIRRVFGFNRSVTYEWTFCDDGLQSYKKAVMSQFSFPKSSFGLYSSAEVHNKRKFKKPWWIWLPVVVLPVAAWAIPAAWDGMGKVLGGANLVPQGMPVVAPPPAAKPLAAPLVPLQPTQGPTPLSTPVSIPLGPASAPVKLAGCASFKGKCTCFDTQGEKVSKEPEFCADRTMASAPAKLADIPESLDRFQVPSAYTPDPQRDDLIAWSNRMADARRAGTLSY